MRITGGRARGIILKLPKRGTLRPATDYLRQAVYSSLGPLVLNARVLDIFAGTGAYGLEALSRGAAHVTSVDANAASITAIQDNLAAVAKSIGAPNPANLGQATNADAFLWQPPTSADFDLIFIAPPYALLPLFGVKLLARAVEWAAPGPQTRILLEAPGDYVIESPPGWTISRRLGKGHRQPSSLIFRRTPDAGADGRETG